MTSNSRQALKEERCGKSASADLDKTGAELLMAALQRFLETGHAVAQVFASDGEGYDLHLVPVAHGDKARHYLDLYGNWRPMSGEDCLNERNRITPR